MIFQDAGASLCPIRTIGDQIYESMRAHKKVSRNEAKDRAMELFEKLNFKDSQRVWDSYPFELSGGMNQRAGIAISMLMNPPILLADEPTSALDVSVQRQVVREMLKLRELFGTAIIIVTHDIGVVRAMAEMCIRDRLFTEPDSPTIPSVSPACKEKLTSSTALKGSFPLCANTFVKCSASKSVFMIFPCLLYTSRCV